VKYVVYPVYTRSYLHVHVVNQAKKIYIALPQRDVVRTGKMDAVASLVKMSAVHLRKKSVRMDVSTRMVAVQMIVLMRNAVMEIALGLTFAAQIVRARIHAVKEWQHTRMTQRLQSCLMNSKSICS
jgi:hypothetical protein